MKKFLKGLFRSTEPLNVIPPEPVKEESKNAEVREIGWFDRANDLINECSLDETKVSSSDLSKWASGDPYLNPNFVKEEYKGFMLYGVSRDEIDYYKEEIDNGYRWRFMPMNTYREKYEGKETLKIEDKPTFEKEELLKDDVSFIEVEKPETKLITTASYAIGIDPYRTEPKSEDHDTNRGGDRSAMED